MWPDRVSNPGPLTYESRGPTNCAMWPGKISETTTSQNTGGYKVTVQFVSHINQLPIWHGSLILTFPHKGTLQYKYYYYL